MKKLIKYLMSLTVIVALSAAFMANTHKTETSTKAENPPPCWILKHVTWSGSCVNYNQNTVYIVNMTITNTCSNPNETLFSETQELSTDNDPETDFCIADTLCTVDQAANCFHVVVSVAKVDKTTQQILCSGQWTNTYNCEGLTYTFPFDEINVNMQ